MALERIEWDTPEGPVLHVRGADLVSGTPIFDIKPYLAYTDSHPDAAGGFTAGLEGERLTVECPAALLDAVPEAQRQGLLSVLANDPGPGIRTTRRGSTAWPTAGGTSASAWRAAC